MTDKTKKPKKDSILHHVITGNHDFIKFDDRNTYITLRDANVSQITTGKGNDHITINGKFNANLRNQAAIDMGAGNDTIILNPGAEIGLPHNWVPNTYNNGKRYEDGSGRMEGQAYISGGKGIDTIVFPADVKLSDVKPFIWQWDGLAPPEVGLNTPNGKLMLSNFERAVIEGKTYAIRIKNYNQNNPDEGDPTAALTPIGKNTTNRIR